MIIDKLISKIRETQNPTVVGLDPQLDFVPEYLKNEMFETYGCTTKGAAEAILRFNMEIIDHVCDLIPAVKPQIAMYEQFGAEGVAAYIKTTQYAKGKGLIVIGDVKRGDIASTAKCYSKAHIGKVKIGHMEDEVFNSDFITVNPYLGYDGIEPYIEDCKENESGLFVLVKTSNPNSGEIQDLIVENQPVHEIVGGLVSKWGGDLIGKHGFSSIGAVVGATHKDQAKRLREIMPTVFFLVPGYGAQGGKAEDLAVCFNENGLGAIVNSSRGIIAAYKNDKYKNDFTEKEFAKASRQAVIDMQEDICQFIHIL